MKKLYKLVPDNDICFKANIEDLTMGQRIIIFFKSILTRKFYQNHSDIFGL